MNAWLFQDHRQKKKLGADCPWSVGWIDPDGKRRSKRIGSKSRAQKFCRRIEGQLAAGVYQTHSRKQWAIFRTEYETKIAAHLATKTRLAIFATLNHFERICKPVRVGTIKTATVDNFISERWLDPGRKPKSTVSPATINHDLRHLKAALKVAQEWGYLAKVPKIRWVREEERIGPVISLEDFQKIYDACTAAEKPGGLHCSPTHWWQALLVFAITTGWRIEEILTFRRSDLDLKTGAILTRAANNKGKRDDLDYLPKVTFERVRDILSFETLVFAWPHNRRTLDDEFHKIQAAAGIYLLCPDEGKHECTDACHRYGFHALRRAYATLNADTMPAAVLQRKMRHRSFTTTLRYIALADKVKKSAEQVFVPEFLNTEKGG